MLASAGARFKQEPPGDRAARRYRLEIEAMPDSAPAVVRLRRVVKALLRHYGFKLLSAVEAYPAAPRGVAQARPEHAEATRPGS